MLSAPSSSQGTATAPSSLPLPRAAAHATRVASFRDALATAQAEPRDSDEIAPARSMKELMEMLMLIQMLGMPAPDWMLKALRAAGLDSLADSLEARNWRIKAHEGTDPESEFAQATRAS